MQQPGKAHKVFALQCLDVLGRDLPPGPDGGRRGCLDRLPALLWIDGQPLDRPLIDAKREAVGTGRGVVLRRFTITGSIHEMRHGRITLAAHMRRVAIVQREDVPAGHKRKGFIERTSQDGCGSGGSRPRRAGSQQTSVSSCYALPHAIAA